MSLSHNWYSTPTVAPRTLVAVVFVVLAAVGVAAVSVSTAASQLRDNMSSSNDRKQYFSEKVI
jgi:hypothetical protein